jgi:hypothetical protein
VNEITHGSLFTGIGGLDLGLERAGMVTKWQVEIDPYCTRVLEKHWPDVPRFKDVRDVGKKNLEAVDVISGVTGRDVMGYFLGAVLIAIGVALLVTYPLLGVHFEFENWKAEMDKKALDDQLDIWREWDKIDVREDS